MKIQLKTSSISLNKNASRIELSNELQGLFFVLDQWAEENVGTIVGIMHSLTFPKEGKLSATVEVNQLLAHQYSSRDWPVIGGDTSGGPDLVLTVTLLGY